jgi:uncharacterized protein (TIGR00255 family)
MIRSMTGFASAKGTLAPHGWTWELRSVNAKGLDLRLRLPEGLNGLEAALRADLDRALHRGNVSLNLRLTREDEAGALRLNRAVLDAVLGALAEVEARALDQGATLAPSRAADLLTLRGVLEVGTQETDTAPLVAQLRAEAGPLIEAFVQMREAEGAALLLVLQKQLDQVGELTARAAELAEARKPVVAETLRANLARVMANAEGADPARVAQELALLAVKSDVTEEIDRLHAHVAAATDLLTAGGPVGRKLDFLMQEFNREANTLCSKAQSSELTTVGLALKAVIDQMREQVQNIE